MVYIVIVNPSILAISGVPSEQVFTATIIAAVYLVHYGWRYLQIIQLQWPQAWVKRIFYVLGCPSFKRRN